MSTVAPVTIDTTRPGIPLSRLVKVELRKMFDTRSGFWLMMSIAIVSAIATIVVVLVQTLNDNAGVTFEAYASAVGFPMAILLPVIAILAVTGEWSQRTGLITFTLVPHRESVIAAKALAAIAVGVVSIVIAMVVGALGNIVGSSIAGEDIVWDVSIASVLLILLANVLGLLVGFMLGVLIRNSAAAIVGYFVYQFVLPGLLALLAGLVSWFDDLRPWVDFNFSQSALFDPPISAEQWGQLATSGLIWFILPLALGIRAVLRSEVK